MESISEEIRDRVIRIEERQKSIASMLQDSLVSHSDTKQRVSALEAFKNKMIGIALAAGIFSTILWEIIRDRIIRHGG